MPRRIPREVTREMPVTGQGLKDGMPGDGTDSKERDEAKSEANSCEGRGGQAIEEGDDGCGDHIIIDIRSIVIMTAGAIPKN